MPIADSSYTSYLLRFWCAEQDGVYTWIACVQSTTTGEQRRFANLEALIRFLRDELGGDGQAPCRATRATGPTEVPD
jgi:hypothetical protein